MFMTPSAKAEDQPLWEIGLGAFTLGVSDYPASGNYRLNGLVYPTLVYRGDKFRIGGDSAAKLVPFDLPGYEIGVSLDAAFGATSEGNPIREGMPDLGLIAEIGPELIVYGPRFAEGTNREGAIDFALQGRAVFTLDLDEGIDYRGIVLEPSVQYRKSFANGAKLTAALGPIFATEELHDLYYGVAPTYARPGRPSYNADAGYLGTEASIGLSVPVTQRLKVYGGFGVGLYSGAANQRSPLFEDELTGYAYLGASITLFKSKTRVASSR